MSAIPSMPMEPTPRSVVWRIVCSIASAGSGAELAGRRAGALATALVGDTSARAPAVKR